MKSNQETAVWRVEEERINTGERRLFIRVPDLSHLGRDINVRVTRDDEPPFLTDEGWTDQALDLHPTSVEIDGKDLLIELSTQHTDEIADYEPVNVSIAETDYASTISWVLQELIRQSKPSIHLSVSDTQVTCGQAVRLSWDAEYVESLEARGQWQGTRELSGAEDIVLDQIGINNFSLVDSTQEEQTSASVIVEVTEAGVGGTGYPGNPPLKLWMIIAALLLVLLLVGLLWYFIYTKEPELENGGSAPPPPPVEEPDPTEKTPILMPVETEGGTVDSELDIERLKRLIRNEKFEDNPATGEIGARSLMTKLTGEGNAEAALIAAESLGDPGFSPGLFDSRSDRQAMQYFRLACQGDVAARDQILSWKNRLQDEYTTQPSEETRDIVNVYIPALLKECK